MPQPSRQAFLNPLQIKMPVGAWTSLGHRITGILLAAGLPLSVYLVDRSMRSEQAFADVSAMFKMLPVKGLAVILLWALSHHLLAGVRHLLTDFNLGSPLRTARRTAWFVNLGAIAVTLVAAGVLL
ncbi:succinate dehydrogenase / fumarate reductase cytochrome b subunit [Variovorax sp. GrIS 2.14]|uniref:succinate dehydrogenase, cytochrome b556 subunit n=1 Tax=Variovorax sp. GrIS 2.14 TaxID=3071709 RepID=UPI0038F6B621